MKAVRTLKAQVASQAGFSLIELMIVVAIIGILASIAVPNFQKFQRKAKQGEAKGYMSAIYTGEKSFLAEWSTYTASTKGIGFAVDANQGCYRAGFAAAPAAIVQAGVTAGDNFSEVPVGGAKTGCTIPAAVTGAVAPGLLTFTAAASGTIGGAVQDDWTINDAKTLSNLNIGL